MNKANVGLYFIDNYIYICNKLNIFAEKIANDIIINNRIADSELFTKIFTKIIKKYKFYDSFSLKNILVVCHPNYLKSDKELIHNILEKSFNKIIFIDYIKLINNNTFTFNQNNALIPVSKKLLFLDYEVIKFRDILDISLLSSNKKSLFLIGNINNIKQLANALEKHFCQKVFIYENHENYIIEKIQKEIK